jgi:transposase-like protein
VRQNPQCPNCKNYTVDVKHYSPTGQTDQQRALMLLMMGGLLLLFVFIAFSFNGAACGGIALPFAAIFIALGVYKVKHQVYQCTHCGMQYSSAEMLVVTQGGRYKTPNTFE